MGWKETMFGSDSQIRSEKFVDPIKEEVASPLSKYLSTQAGQGVPRYEGQILSDMPQEGMNRASEFLSMDSETFFNEKIKTPAMQTFRDEMLPLVREDFAGSLSGSGRYRTEEAAASSFSRSLAQTRANLEIQLPQAQFEMAKAIKVEQDKENVAQYQDWMKSLPQYNPALAASLTFLQDSTSSGTTLLSYLDEGSNGWMYDVGMALAGGGGGGGSASGGGAAAGAGGGGMPPVA